MIRPYFFSKSDQLRGEPRQVRTSLSQAAGQIFNRVGIHWQALVNDIQELASVHGTISKIDMIDSHGNNQWLEFTIYYDEPEAAKKFVHYLEVFNKLQPINHFINLRYAPPPPVPQPTPQPATPPAPEASAQ